MAAPPESAAADGPRQRLPPALTEALGQFCQHLDAERTLSRHTVRAYNGDIQSLLDTLALLASDARVERGRVRQALNTVMEVLGRVDQVSPRTWPSPWATSRCGRSAKDIAHQLPATTGRARTPRTRWRNAPLYIEKNHSSYAHL
jgi:hypothetical protein